jgi:hypothetical protein
MVTRSVMTYHRNDIDEVFDLAVLIERLKRLRALNKGPGRIGLTQYKWRSLSIDKTRKR